MTVRIGRRAALAQGGLMSHVSRAGIGLAVALVLAGCGRDQEAPPRPQPPEGAVAGDFSVVPCVHMAREVEYAAECGTLIVPENRHSKGSRLIALPVKRILASG